MKYAISARGIDVVAGGVKEYTNYLILGLIAQKKVNEELHIYYDSKQLFGTYSGKNVFEHYVSGLDFILGKHEIAKLFWDHVFLPLALQRDKIEVAMFPRYIRPLFTRVKTIVAAHDFAYFMPELKAYKPFDTIYMKWMIPRSLRKSDVVFSISKHTKQDALKFVRGLDPEKVIVNYLDGAYKYDPKHKVDVRTKYKIGQKPYIFLASSVSPRKNLGAAIKTMAELKDKIPHNFVITGAKSWGNTGFEEMLTEYGVADRFLRLGFVDNEDMPSLYAEADAYFHPSLYEGFSMTIVEAMYSQTPIAASNSSCHPEIVGDAGVLFDPLDAKNMSQKLYQVLTDKKLRQKLIQAGNKRRLLFGWDKNAKLTLETFRSLTSTK